MDLNLRERSVVILGSVHSTLQNLVMSLTQQGADVSIVGAEADKMAKFCQMVTDQREGNEKFGRATAIPIDPSKPSALKDGLGKAAQTFGSIDIFIDAMVSHTPTPFVISGEDTNLEKIVQDNLITSLRATQYVAGFLKGRKRGRIIYLLQDAMNRGTIEDAVATAARTGVLAFAKTLARQMQEFNVTVNCLSLGLSEEYLLGHFPDCTSIKEAAEKIKKVDPMMRITDSEKVANSIIYLCSSSGASVTGQHLTLS